MLCPLCKMPSPSQQGDECDVDLVHQSSCLLSCWVPPWISVPQILSLSSNCQQADLSLFSLPAGSGLDKYCQSTGDVHNVAQCICHGQNPYLLQVFRAILLQSSHGEVHLWLKNWPHSCTMADRLGMGLFPSLVVDEWTSRSVMLD